MPTFAHHPGSHSNMISAPVVMATSAALLFFQTLDTSGIAASAERLTLVGALVIAVGVLWKSNSRKDDQMLDMAKAVTDALRSDALASTELRNMVKDSTRAKDDLTKSIEALRAGLGTLPCVNDPDIRPPHVRK